MKEEKHTGIYMIQSISKLERVYIGSAVDITKRMWYHLHDLRNNRHHSSKLQRHYNKYGESDLIFSVVEQFELISKEHILDREQFYIDTLDPYFNICKTAGSCLGVKASKETREKISKALLGRPGTNIGVKASIETRKKMSIKRQGRTPALGMHHSEQTKQYIKNLDLIRSMSEPVKKDWIKPRGRAMYLGVHYIGNSIRAAIKINKIALYLGTFKTEKEAAWMYDQAAIMYRGKYANLNFPDK